MLPAGGSGPARGDGELGGATAWTGEKRRKSTRLKSIRLKSTLPSPLGVSGDDASMMDVEEEQGRKGLESTLPSPLGFPGDDASMMDIEQEQGRKGSGGKQPPEEHEGEDTGSVVYSVNDEISLEDVQPYLNKLKSRKPPILGSYELKPHPLLSEEEAEKLTMRFYNLRFRDYCKIKGLGDIELPKRYEEFPDDVKDWDEPHHLFDWTIESSYFHLAELNEYQRILPAREEIGEYCYWDDYSTTFSNYETDVDYVMYCDALSKKIKWIEEYLDRDRQELLNLEHRGFSQAMKIAADFCHLPFSLAMRGYKEYIFSLKCKSKRRDYDRLYFELWKRVTKEKISFIEALREIREANMFEKHASIIEAEIQGSIKKLKYEFDICKDNIPKSAVEDDEVLKHITFAVYNKMGDEKVFLDFTIKKLKIARRLHLTPSRCFTQKLERVLDCKGEE